MISTGFCGTWCMPYMPVGTFGDGVDHLHALDHLAEHRVAKVACAIVKEGVVGVVDEELAGGRVDSLGAGQRRCCRAGSSGHCWLCCGSVRGCAFAACPCQNHPLNHEVGNYAMELRAVVVAVFDIGQEVFHADRCLAGIQFQFDLAHAGVL